MTPILDLEARMMAQEQETRELRKALNRTIRLVRLLAKSVSDPLEPEVLRWLQTPTWGEELTRTLAEAGESK
jgi:hypothetical protein